MGENTAVRARTFKVLSKYAWRRMPSVTDRILVDIQIQVLLGKQFLFQRITLSSSSGSSASTA